jgi:hypothetical protein
VVPNQKVSRTIRPRMDEPSVYETEYSHVPPEPHERQCMPAGGRAHSTFDEDVDLAGSKREPGVFECWCTPQCPQSAHGNAVSADPVSMIRSNDLDGVPTQTCAEK